MFKIITEEETVYLHFLGHQYKANKLKFNEEPSG